MAEFINLNYFFRADFADYELILKKGFFDNHETNGEYGKAIYLFDNKNINPNNKNIILNVDLLNIDNILFVESYDLLITHYIASNNPQIINECKILGRTSILGNRYIKKFALNNGLSGIKIKDENILVLYNTKNIRIIRLYDEDLKTLRNYTPTASPAYAILHGPELPMTNPNDTDEHNKTGSPIVDENGNIITWGLF